ncbi:MAG: hypothetical protein QG567_1930 [Campylobacterota bacterium]|nr:hypothetical protein [Campylobacterota bacterium]
MTNCKVCTKCGKQKKLYQFNVHNLSRDGRVDVCNLCKSKAVVDVKSTRDKIKLYFEENK